jgi:hypothetical protein
MDSINAKTVQTRLVQRCSHDQMRMVRGVMTVQTSLPVVARLVRAIQYTPLHLNLLGHPVEPGDDK